MSDLQLKTNYILLCSITTVRQNEHTYECYVICDMMMKRKPLQMKELRLITFASRTPLLTIVSPIIVDGEIK